MIEGQGRCDERRDSEELDRVDELTASHGCVVLSGWLEGLESAW